MFFNLSGLTLTENYKQDAGGPESGSLLGSYTTTFNADLSGFTIVYDGGSTFDRPTCVLYVKDGSPRPQYFFDLGDWNGTETITGSGFYPEQGAISHVDIFGWCGDISPRAGILDAARRWISRDRDLETEVNEESNSSTFLKKRIDKGASSSGKRDWPFVFPAAIILRWT